MQKNAVLKPPDNWPRTLSQAWTVQDSLRQRVLVCPPKKEIVYVAGLDVSYPRDRTQPAKGAGVVLDKRDLSLKEKSIVRQHVYFPYVPGFLSFREVPVLMAVLEGLSSKPDLVLCDGQGIAHPKRFGLACHLGVLSGLPTIGVAKSRLTGIYKNLEKKKGSWQPLLDKKEMIGAVVRTRSGVKPVFVSIGYKFDLPSAIKIVLGFCPKYKIPEPIRKADQLCSHEY